MDKDEIQKIEANIEYQQMEHHQKLISEFEKLGVNESNFTSYLTAFSPLLVLFLSNSMFNIEIALFQTLSVIFIVSATVQNFVLAQNKKTNRRIDLLVKILKQEKEEIEKQGIS